MHDGQTKARSLYAVYLGTDFPGEGLIHLILKFFRHANTIIGHTEHQAGKRIVIRHGFLIKL